METYEMLTHIVPYLFHLLQQQAPLHADTKPCHQNIYSTWFTDSRMHGIHST